MCGIVGGLKKDGQAWQVGQHLLTMADCLLHRGQDSSGVAVFAAPGPLRLHWTFPGAPVPEVSKWLQRELREAEALLESQSATITLPAAPAPDVLLQLIQKMERAVAGSTVMSAGRSLQLVKKVGSISVLRPSAQTLLGTHGIGHLRMATESAVDAAHAQPFWGRPYPDLAVVHNGHITNSLPLKQHLQSQGFSFSSHNDSEIIAVLLGQKLAEGQELPAALRDACTRLDGSFAIIAATSKQLAATRDRFGTKPLLLLEDSHTVSLASEPRALQRVSPEARSFQEIHPWEVASWTL